jgi:hypothetical protein
MSEWFVTVVRGKLIGSRNEGFTDASIQYTIQQNIEECIILHNTYLPTLLLLFNEPILNGTYRRNIIITLNQTKVPIPSPSHLTAPQTNGDKIRLANPPHSR